jgi:hypothetical protein
MKKQKQNDPASKADEREIDSEQDKSLSGREKESGSENDQPVPFPQPYVDVDWPPE